MGEEGKKPGPGKLILVEKASTSTTTSRVGPRVPTGMEKVLPGTQGYKPAMEQVQYPVVLSDDLIGRRTLVSSPRRGDRVQPQKKRKRR